MYKGKDGYEMKIFIVRKRVLLSAFTALAALLLLIPLLQPLAEPAAGTATDTLPIYAVETAEKKVAVTFNAAWDDSGLDSILETLTAYDCRCTFFLVGTWAEKYPEAARKIKEAGHEIASHSYDHAHYTALESAEMQADVEKADAVIKEITGIEAALFRAPYGEYTSELVRYCRETGRYCIQWDTEPMAAVGKPLPVRA